VNNPYPLNCKIPNTRLTPFAVGRWPIEKGGYFTLLCKCDCGRITENAISNIRRSRVKSCGCLHLEVLENSKKLFLPYSDEEAIAAFKSKIDVVHSGCWNWFATRNTCGYGVFCFRGKNQLAHRVSWLIHKGHIPNGRYVLHRCDNPRCVNPDHLFLGTQTDNMRDAVRKGRLKTGNVRGTDQPLSPFVESQVHFIRLASSEGFSRSSIARYFGVCRTSIDAIVNRKTWRHI
jgi:HNH endonuclease